MNNDEPQRQLTIDAAVAVLQNELRHMHDAIHDGQARLEARLEGQSRVLTDTREMVREANSKAATALRMADANAADIQAIQEWRRSHDEAISAVGGTEKAVASLKKLLGEQRDGYVRRSEWKRILGWVTGGVSLGLAIAKGLYEMGALG